MAFQFGPFMSGLSSGANNAMDMYDKYMKLQDTKDLREGIAKAKAEDAAKGGAVKAVGAGMPTPTGSATGGYADVGYPEGGPTTVETPKDTPTGDTTKMPEPRRNPIAPAPPSTQPAVVQTMQNTQPEGGPTTVAPPVQQGVTTGTTNQNGFPFSKPWASTIGSAARSAWGAITAPRRLAPDPSMQAGAVQPGPLTLDKTYTPAFVKTGQGLNNQNMRTPGSPPPVLAGQANRVDPTLAGAASGANVGTSVLDAMGNPAAVQTGY